MCLLLVLRGLHPEYPLLIANNRDEYRSRPSAPPGLWVGSRHRVLSPRDRAKQGTWLGINDAGMFAGLTNLHDPAPDPTAPSRGELPHLVLDSDNLDEAARALQQRVAGAGFRPFQLLAATPRRSLLAVHDGAELQLSWPKDEALLITNEHRLGELSLPGLEGFRAPDLSLEARIDGLQTLLSTPPAPGRHAVLKTGEDYGTVSSGVLALPVGGAPLIWRHAQGRPDQVAYKNYGNLQRRLSAPA